MGDVESWLEERCQPPMTSMGYRSADHPLIVGQRSVSRLDFSSFSTSTFFAPLREISTEDRELNHSGGDRRMPLRLSFTLRSCTCKDIAS